jgi:TolB-like protein
MSFFEELKRRKVFRVAATYAVVAWILMQIGEVTFPALNIPEWVMSTLVVVLLSGFPIAVIFAWIFDKTPQGYIKTDSPETENIGGMNVKVDNRPFYLQKRNIILVLGVLVGVLIGTYGGSTLTSPDADDKSVAVLPFDNLGSDENDEIFSDGITEDIISQLSNIKDIRVIARTSVLQYKGTTKNIVDIAKELGVNTILEGSVRRIGEDVRIVSQLIDIKKDDHLWAGTYDRKMKNIFEVQTDVAKKIAYALKSKLSPEEESRIDQVPTQNLEAYTLYKKGKEKYYEYTESGYRESIDYYKRALNVDPIFALAYSGLGDSYGQLFSNTRDTLYRDLGFAAAEKSLKINENLAEGYKALALLFAYTGDSNNSLKYNLKTIQLKPGFSDAIGNVGLRYRNKGDLSEALEWYLKAHKMDPFNRRNHWHVGFTHELLGEYKIAEDLYLEGLLKHNDSFECLSALVFYHLNFSRPNKAKYYLDELLRLRPNDNRSVRVALSYFLNIKDFDNAMVFGLKIKQQNISDKISLAFLEKRLKNNEIANKYLTDAINQLDGWIKSNDQSANAYYQLAKINSLSGDYNKAFDLLETMVDMGGLNYKRFMASPFFNNLRNDPRYFKLIDRIKTIIDRERIEAGLVS